MTFPALGDVTAKGTITRIDPVGTVSSSVVTFGVTVRLAHGGALTRSGSGDRASVTVTTATATDVGSSCRRGSPSPRPGPVARHGAAGRAAGASSRCRWGWRAPP